VTPTPFVRQHSLERLASEQFDLLVIGGGVTGCGVALDAAARGLRTALVEAEDFASGTSSRSSKLVHGGLRYLQQHDYRLVYEALRERQRLLRNAPHLVHPLPFLIPLFGRDGVVATSVAKAYSVALWWYDLTGGVRIGHRHSRVGAGTAKQHFPALRPDRLVDAFLYWDAQTDDARLTLALARTAAAYGATLANYAPVTSVLEDGRRVAGVRLANGIEVRATAVINATGVWSERVGLRTEGGRAVSPVAIRPAKGIHLVVPADKLPCDYAAVLPVPRDKRSIFVVPWAAADHHGTLTGVGRYTYLGTTDTDYDGPLDDPRCTPEDIDYLLDAVNHWTTVNLTAEDVTGSWAGLRPLLSTERRARSADLSRRHATVRSPNGLITVTGGKLTTYRKMAADAVDMAAQELSPGRGRTLRRSPTRRLKLVGASPGPAPASSGVGLDPATCAQLRGRHGFETEKVLALARTNPSLAEPLVEGLLYLRAEAVWAVREEMAQTLIDVLARRTRALMLDGEATARAAPEVAALIASELGWDEAETSRQLADLQHHVEADRGALDLASRRAPEAAGGTSAGSQTGPRRRP
jgi:glycerol-3-phosphate dehydrogenase